MFSYISTRTFQGRSIFSRAHTTAAMSSGCHVGYVEEECDVPTPYDDRAMTYPPYTVGWVHNLEYAPPDSHCQRAVAIAVVFPVISVVAASLGIAIRLIVSSIGWDDVYITISTLLGIGYSAVTIVQMKWGLGLGPADFPAVNAIPFRRVQYASGPLYCLAVLGFKLSLLTGYLRVAGFNQSYARIFYGVTAVVVVSQLLFTCLPSFTCLPVAKMWNLDIPGRCIDAVPTYFALGITSLVWDLLIIVLPFPILRRLQLDRRNKIALGALFGLGFFVTIIQALRMQNIAALKIYIEAGPVIEWSIVEINLGVFVACVPAYASRLKAFGRKFVSRGSRSRSEASASAYPEGKRNTVVVKENPVNSKLDDDEVELCDHPWVNQGHVEHNVHTHGSGRMPVTHRTVDSIDGDDQSGTSAESRSSTQRIHVLYEVTVEGKR